MTGSPVPPDDAAAFAAWVEPHVLLLTALAGRQVGAADGDDVVQEALVRAWQRRTTFDPAKGTPRTWLIAITLERARRHRSRGHGAPRLALVDQPLPTPSPAVRLDVEQAVRALPRRQREVITLHYLADLTVSEVASVLQISDGSVKSHLFDARAALRRSLEGE